MTYDPRKDPHPIEPQLRAIGELTLVGSRAQRHPTCATPESDYDFYLHWPVCRKGMAAKDYRECQRPRGHNDACRAGREKYPESAVEYGLINMIIQDLERMGFARLPGEGGPYGRDEGIQGVWRLSETEAFGRKWPHVDVIVCDGCTAMRRLYVLRGLWETDRGGQLLRGVKSETAWGMFWWAAGRMAV